MRKWKLQRWSAGRSERLLAHSFIQWHGRLRWASCCSEHLFDITCSVGFRYFSGIFWIGSYKMEYKKRLCDWSQTKYRIQSCLCDHKSNNYRNVAIFSTYSLYRNYGNIHLRNYIPARLIKGHFFFPSLKKNHPKKEIFSILRVKCSLRGLHENKASDKKSTSALRVKWLS